MTAGIGDLKRECGRQLEHWRLAAVRLGHLDAVGTPSAWAGLEHYLGLSLRQTLRDIVARLVRTAAEIGRRLAAAQSAHGVAEVRAGILEFRRAYSRAETAVDFFADALATRASPYTGALLRACDHIATRSMAEALTPLGRQVPQALSYMDAGLGASVLKAGLRLWDGTAENPVAAIKVVRHNLLGTSLIHEAGHQVAHMLGWNDQLRAAFQTMDAPARVRASYASWASEIAADAFAFVHTGYASAVALHDVIDGPDASVFQYLPQDPHAISYLRLRIVLEWARQSYGAAGPWQQMEATWVNHHPLSYAPSDLREFLQECVAALPRVAAVVLTDRYPAFNRVALTSLVDPQRVSPASLYALERSLGQAAQTSPYMMWNESIRLLALNGLRAAEGAAQLREVAAQQEKWMLRLGGLQQAA